MLDLSAPTQPQSSPGHELVLPGLALHGSLSRYVLLGVLGRGGMGTVLEAYDPSLDRRVALKVLHHDVDDAHLGRLIREAKAMAKLSHPNVVQVFEVGMAEDRAFIAMELVRGPSLRDFIHQVPRPPWRECVRVLLEAGQGLAAAHREGLVHRDFKPANVIIDEQGRARVLDFGLARQADAPTDEALGPAGPEPGDTPPCPQTHSGPRILGTPAYMPPEQVKAGTADARSDQFGFCVSLYEALYGERPFEGRSMAARMRSIQQARVRPPPRGTRVPAAIRRVVLRGLAYRPERRWPSMAALLTQLRRRAAPQTRRRFALGMVIGLSSLGVGLVRYAEVGQRCRGATEKLHGVWDPPRRQQIRDARLAPETRDRVQQRLDDYAHAWAKHYTEVCEATAVRQEQSPAVMDLRMRCLERRRSALRETVGVLVQADPTQAAQAMNLAIQLPALSRCDDIDALHAEAAAPEDPTVASWVDALREPLAQARARATAGELSSARALVDPVVDRAQLLGYPPLQADALLIRGRIHQRAGRYADARADLERAYRLAAEHGHHPVEAETAAVLCVVVGVDLARHELGLQWGQTALALGRRQGPIAEARALNSVGAVMARQREYAAALRHHQRALTLSERILDTQHPAVADGLDHIGRVLHAQQKWTRALAHHRRALTIREHTLGPQHHAVGRSLVEIGHALLATQGPKPALTHYRRAQEILERALGSDSPDVAELLQSIGIALGRLGDLEGGLSHHQRALALHDSTRGPAHPCTIRSRILMGEALHALGRLEPARAHYRRALDLAQQVLDPQHPDYTRAADQLRRVEQALGDRETLGLHAEPNPREHDRPASPTQPRSPPPTMMPTGRSREAAAGRAHPADAPGGAHEPS